MDPCVVSAVKSGAVSLIRGTLWVSLAVAVLMIWSPSLIEIVQDSEKLNPPQVSDCPAKDRRYAHPITGVGRKNLAGSLPTRRATTTHALGGGRDEHVL